MALIIWIVISIRKSPKAAKQDKKSPAPDSSAAIQDKEYLARQWVERNVRSQNKPKATQKRTYKRPAPRTPTYRGVLPAEGYYTPAPKPSSVATASSDDAGLNFVTGMAAGMLLEAALNPTSSSTDDDRPVFTSGDGGDFGGGGASGSWDSSTPSLSSTDSTSSSND